MDFWVVIIFAITIAICLGIGCAMIAFRKRKNISYTIDTQAKYGHQVFYTFLKYLPYAFILTGIILIVFLIRLLMG